MGIKTVRLKRKVNQHCILCGLCVRACEEMVGVSAIGFASRGTDKEINTPFGAASDVCIGCGTCTYICPTGCIEMAGEPGPPGGKKMHIGKLNLKPCPTPYTCEACAVDHEFIKEMKQVVQDVRRRP
jgi:ferredoxin